MIQMSEKDFMQLLHKYWDYGMNNSYWQYLQQEVWDDISKHSTTLPKKKDQLGVQYNGE